MTSTWAATCQWPTSSDLTSESGVPLDDLKLDVKIVASEGSRLAAAVEQCTVAVGRGRVGSEAGTCADLKERHALGHGDRS